METIQELRLDTLLRGFVIAERVNKNGDIVTLSIFKEDTDGVRTEYAISVYVNTYGWTDVYVNTLKDVTKNIDTIITNRHNQDIKSCEHSIIMNGTNKVCRHCMGRFGTFIPLDLNFN